MAEWISVKDRLPPPFVSVLGHINNAGDFPSVRECYLVEKEFFFPALDNFEPIDMWMEMPESPSHETLLKGE